MNYLDTILEARRRDVERRTREVPLSRVRRLARKRATSRDFACALRSGSPAVIAEFKRSSPSAGALGNHTVGTTAAGYESAGAAAISVLTEPNLFNGDLNDIIDARAACSIPVLRKDFIIDPYQIWESAAVGADAILLIVAALEASELRDYRLLAESLGMCALVEVHDEPEASGALASGATVIGINNRDLKTLDVDRETALRLRRHIPSSCVVVAESGYTRAGQLDQCVAAGIHAVLVGEALMRASDPESALRALLGAPV